MTVSPTANRAQRDNPVAAERGQRRLQLLRLEHAGPPLLGAHRHGLHGGDACTTGHKVHGSPSPSKLAP